MKGYRHRETKGYLYSNRQITDDYMCQLVLAKTSPGAPCAWRIRQAPKKDRKQKEPLKRAIK